MKTELGNVASSVKVVSDLVLWIVAIDDSDLSQLELPESQECRLSDLHWGEYTDCLWDRLSESGSVKHTGHSFALVARGSRASRIKKKQAMVSSVTVDTAAAAVRIELSRSE